MRNFSLRLCFMIDITILTVLPKVCCRYVKAQEMAVNVGLLSRASINMSKWHKHERLAHYMQTSAP